eukprot:CAMPEP_0197025294 /NCGR_PEP_ID=MMETSP1384-20130603/5679_1 /TAXON_ID=29189 /ORGANISM="Ammonia sp." /LENGTH=607 /DNA_ID=CAMNT_0042453811 /DNA_START=38 /DNA_END=1861 /DNA_ORIENTATION=+
MTSSFYSIISQIFETITPTQNELNDTNDISHHQLDGSEHKASSNEEETASGILSVTFNQDCSCISVATMSGFRIYQCKPFTKAFECNNNHMSCRKVSMLFATSLVALMGGGLHLHAHHTELAPSHQQQQQQQDEAAHAHTLAHSDKNSHNSSLRNVKLYNTKNKQELCRLNFKSTVLNVKMNKSRLAICVEHKIHIFDLINNMKQIYELPTYSNPYGIFDLCCDDDNCLIAYPEKSSKGSIGILDAYNLQKRAIFHAHDSLLQHMAFNADGNYLCSASIMGTLIRIFAIPSGTHMYTFRRGTYPSSIYSMSFNPSCTFLSVSSQRNINIPSINSLSTPIVNTSSSVIGTHPKPKPKSVHSHPPKQKQKQKALQKQSGHKKSGKPAPTIHIFDLNKYKYNEAKKISSSHSINQLNSKLNEYLPQSVKNQIEHPRSIITINIKNISPVICGWLNDYSLVCATKNGYFYRYSINDHDHSYKLLSEHTLKDNDCDLHKQQKTKIYKTVPKDDEDDDADSNVNVHDNDNDTENEHGMQHENDEQLYRNVDEHEHEDEREHEQEHEFEDEEHDQEDESKQARQGKAGPDKTNIDDLFDESDAEFDESSHVTPM